jgi:hypothetical protein
LKNRYQPEINNNAQQITPADGLQPPLTSVVRDKKMTDWTQWDDRKLPEKLCEKVQSFPESSMSANRVTLTLSNGTLIHNVIIADGAWIAKIGDKMIKTGKDLDFNPSEIEDITSEV